MSNCDFCILCIVGPQHAAVGKYSVEMLRKLYAPADVIALCSKSTFQAMNVDCKFLDENDVIEKVFFIDEYKRMFGTDVRSSWYYQQFLKYECSKYAGKKYVIVDGDTIILRPVWFYDGAFTVFNKKTEHHIPYFQTMTNIFGDMKFSSSSFISEYMPFQTNIVDELTNIFRKINDSKKWYFNVLSKIPAQHVFGSGYSEYETYGNYMINFHPDIIKEITLNTCRNGKSIINVNDISLNKLEHIRDKYNLDTITFEIW